jgi:hypothetical protein
MAEQPPSTTINPGQHKNFIYVGEFIPNVILVKNLGKGTTEARFKLTSTSAPPTPPGWDYYGDVAGSAPRSFTVHFPTARLTVYNVGATPIEVAGEGIRPS